MNYQERNSTPRTQKRLTTTNITKLFMEPMSNRVVTVRWKKYSNWPTPASFLFHFRSFKQNITEKTVGGILTRIVGVEVGHADHLTTATF